MKDKIQNVSCPFCGSKNFDTEKLKLENILKVCEEIKVGTKKLPKDKKVA